MRENPIEMDDLEGTYILGNLHIMGMSPIPVDPQWCLGWFRANVKHQQLCVHMRTNNILLWGSGKGPQLDFQSANDYIDFSK